MATTDQYLIYYIYLSDLALIQSLQGSLVTPSPGIVGNGIGAILAAPDTAAIKYSAPKLPAHSAVVAPGIASTWFGTEDHFPTDVATFDRKSGGWFGWSWLFGDTTHYHWRGIFVYAPPAVPVTGGQNTSVRRWIDGFELPGGGEGGAGAMPYGKEGSRHVEGMGLMLRSSTAVHSHSLSEYGGSPQLKSWERFYVRARTYPAAPTTFWRAKTSVSPLAGVDLMLSPTGQVVINSVDAANTRSFVATAATVLGLDTWHRIDMFITAKIAPATSGDFQMWIDGTVVATVQIAGLGSSQHASSEIGGTVANTMALDVDDWMNAAQPATPDGIDFQSGSGMFLVGPTTLDAASDPLWVGDARALAQNPATNALATVTSASAGVNLIANTDWHEVIAESLEGIGMVAMVACLKATGVQAANSLGFIATDLAAPKEGVGTVMGTGWLTFLWSLAASAAALKPTNSINLVYRHGNAGATTVTHLFAVVELIGIFGTEDAPHLTPQPKGLPTRLGIHNSPYPRTPWARLTTPPIQPVLVVTGSYVGNGTGQDLTFEVPVHFFRTRPLTAEAGGAMWFSSLLGAHTSIEQQTEAAHMVRAKIDPAFVPAGLDAQQQQTILSITGNHAQSNANGVTYAYVALCDPGMRFMLAGAIKNHKGTVDMTTALAHPNFTPLAGLFHFEAPAGASTAGLWLKGVGHLTQSLSAVGAGGEVTNALQFALGSLTNRSAFNALVAADTVPFLLFRNDDTSLLNGVSNAGKVFQVFSYVGDGNASRTVACSPASGKRPMWAIVAPVTTNALYRDPYHTGTQSSVFNGAINASTGIIGGGIDSISVGSALNVNNVVYNVIVVPGFTTGPGWSDPGPRMPVPPEPPPDAPSPPDPPQPPNAPPTPDPAPPPLPAPDPLPPTGPMPGLTDDLDPACEPDTRRIINVALSRLGNTQQIGNVATDTTIEAITARLEYLDAVQQTLRDFPWPFATRYVQLALLNAGAKPNSDWRYAYRQPIDCLFERRLVVSRGAAADPAPAPFALSTDDTGGVIFTNLANAVLEYTARPKCPHTRSEPLFRDAVAWRLALALAPSLSRMTDAAINCAKMYATTIELAKQVIRPGNPGDVPAAATVDTSAAAQAANLAVVNRALIRIGARTIRDLTTDQSREATLARVALEGDLQATLREVAWPFATRYAALVVVSGPAPPANADWLYAYRRPADCVFSRRLVVDRAGAVDPATPPFQSSTDTDGGLILTNLAGAVLEYTARPDGVVALADALFQDALAWRLAGSLAPSLAPTHPQTAEQLGRGPDDAHGQTVPSPGDTPRLADMVTTAQRMYAAVIAQAHDIIEQGKPGAVPAAPTIDVAAPKQAANVAVVNLALVRLGARTIRDLTTDQSREAQTARLVFERELRMVLRDVAWPFATAYAPLAVVSGPAPPANADWRYAYRRPADCVFERRLVVDRAGAVDPAAPPFQLSSDATGGLLLANVAGAVLEYTNRPDGVVALGDDLFTDALAWKLAASLAPSVAPVRPQTAEQIGRGPDEPGTKRQILPAPGEHPRLADVAVHALRMYEAAIDRARRIVEQGKPGALPAGPTIDTAGPAQAANVAVVNLALVRIGARTIRDLTADQSREAQTARMVFESELRTVLRDFPWAFATVYATPTLVGGTASVAVNGDWQYSYRLPADVIFVRRIVTAARRTYERNPPPFKVARDVTGGLLFTDVDTPVLEYTSRLDGAVLASDALFQSALAWKLAATLAPALALALPETSEQIGRGPRDGTEAKERPATGAQLRARSAELALRLYRDALRTAALTAANEAQPDLTQGDPDWITGR